MKISFKILLPFLILSGGLLLASGILSASVKGVEKKNSSKVIPLVETRVLQAVSHQVTLITWGEVQATEKTLLSLQVSGRVNQIHASFIAGGIIKKGDIILTIEPEDYQTQLIESEAALANAISALELSKAKANVAKENLKNVAIDKRSALGLHQPQLRSAQAAVRSAQARLSQSKRNLARTQLIAPYDALVIEKNVGLGQLANSGNKLGEIYNIESAEVHLPIPRQDMPFLPKDVHGLEAQIGFEQGFRAAIVDRDLGIIDGKTRMNHIIVVIQDPYGIRGKVARLKFGQFVEVNVQAKQLAQVYLLDQDELDNNQVWLLDNDSSLKPQTITVLRTEGKVVFVTGLTDDDVLVSQTPEYPQKGMKVRSQHSLLAQLSKLNDEGK
ncbi:MAG: efflux RND transporter periplasmic adaptor subunit [Colwellia sp.]|nr:efflux RND transporter periplasmic adaptor subunit [Colwellia sp.]